MLKTTGQSHSFQLCRKLVLERFYNIREQLYQVIKRKIMRANRLEVLNYIGSILDVGGQIDAVYLEMSKD
jgi:hypothetical protein